MSKADDVFRGMFYGLGSDGTVSANKNSIKILGENTDWNAQGYFVYDSKKAGAVTVSHVRFAKNPIRSPYLISRAPISLPVTTSHLSKSTTCLRSWMDGGSFLLTSPYDAKEVWDHLPIEMQEQLIAKKANFYRH